MVGTKKKGGLRWWMTVGVALALGEGLLDEFGCSSDPVEDVGNSAAQQQDLVSDNRGNPARTGVYPDGYLTPQAMDAGFKESPFRYKVDGPVYAQPLIIPQVPLASGGTVDLLLVATTRNKLYAFDAAKVGSAPLWTVDSNSPTNFGVPPNIGSIGGNPIPDSGVDAANACANIGNLGLLSTPVINGTTAYVMAASRTFNSDLYAFNLYSVDLTSGAATKATNPVGYTTAAGATFKAQNQIQRPGLALVSKNGKSYVIAAFSSSCDAPNPFYGWVFAFDVGTSGMPMTGAFADSDHATSTPQGGIWMSGAAPAVDPNGNIYFLSGNGDSYIAGQVFSDSAFKLSLDAQGNFVVPSSTTNYTTPGNWHDLQACDLDLGVSGTVYIDDPTTPMLLYGSKLGNAYLANAANLGGVDGGLDLVQASCMQFAAGGTAGLYCAAITQPTKQNCIGAQQPPAFLNQGTTCPLGQATDGGPGNWPLNCVSGQQAWPHIHGTPVFWKNGGNLVYLAGQYDYIRQLGIDINQHKFTAPSTYAYADTPAPTRGYGAIMSLAETNDGGYQGVLFANEQAPLEAGAAPPGAWPDHSDSERALGALYALNATADAGKLQSLYQSANLVDAGDGGTKLQLSTYHSPWLLSKFNPPTIYKGTIYLATFSDEVIVLGFDSDNDSVPDGLDNCPTVSNADQHNTNEDAERVKGQPLLGDACDPNASTEVLNSGYVIDTFDGGLNGPCDLWQSGQFVDGGAGTCPMLMNTQLSFTGYIGNDAGNAPSANGSSGPAFCSCNNATLSESARQTCLKPQGAGGGNCIVANDQTFPPFNGNPPLQQGFPWVTITQVASGTPQTFAAINVVHDEPNNASPVLAGWDLYRDYNRNAQNNTPPDAGLALEGLLWGHVMSFSPAGGGELPAPNNLSTNNSYRSAHAEFSRGMKISLPNPWTKPIYQPWLWGQQAVQSIDPAWLVPYPSAILVQERGGMAQSNRFTAGARGLMGSLNQNTTTRLLNNDGARRLPDRSILGAVVNVDTSNTLQINGALVSQGYLVDALGLTLGSATPTVANSVAYAMDSEGGMLYVLTRDPGSGAQALSQVDIQQALHGVLPSSTALAGGTFGTPLSLQFDNANATLYLLDRLDSGGNSALRLLSIKRDGTTQALWSTLSVSSAAFPTQAFLSADLTGALTISLTVPGGSPAELMTVDVNGVPLRSFESTAAIGSRVTAERNGALWAVNETYDQTSTYWTLNPTRYAPSQLLPLICGASWLRSVAGSTGVLATSVAACGRVTNGGFETGDFQDWLPTGATETISPTAHGGNYSAMLGAITATNGDSTVSQTLQLSPSGGTLTFWYWITCPDTVQYDWFTAVLKNTMGTTLATVTPKTCVASSGWTQVSFNLSAYGGQTVVLSLTSHDDNYGADPSYTLVDDVSIQ